MSSQTDTTDRIKRGARQCRTRAFGAELFSGLSHNPANADMWAYIARSWEDLARIKEAQVRMEHRKAFSPKASKEP